MFMLLMWQILAQTLSQTPSLCANIKYDFRCSVSVSVPLPVSVSISVPLCLSVCAFISRCYASRKVLLTQYL